MPSITDEEKKAIKGLFKYYELTGQEMLGIVNQKRGKYSNHINIGRITEVKQSTIEPMSKEELDEWLGEDVKRELKAK